MRAIYSVPFLCDLLVDNGTGDHYVDVLGGGRGAYVTRLRITPEEATLYRQHHGALEEFALRVSDTWRARDAAAAI